MNHLLCAACIAILLSSFSRVSAADATQPTSMAATQPALGDVIVAADGSGKYKTILEAVNASPQTASAEKPWTIYIKAGTYKELIHVQREKRFVRLVGEDAEKTTIAFDLRGGMKGADGNIIGTFRTPTLHIDADDFTVENLIVANTAGAVGQALALRVDGDRVIFRNCQFTGWQDTILATRGRQYFVNCDITGATDFIFGGATAYFDRCHIHCAGNGYITAASTPDNEPYGFVFDHCTIDAATPEIRTFLGRPWRAYSSCTWLNTEMSEAVRPIGWDNWKSPIREKTARYAEYNSRGPGGDISQRVAWAKQLTLEQAHAYTVENVLWGHDQWNPTRPALAASIATSRPSTRPATAPIIGTVTRDVQYGEADGEKLLLDACVPDNVGDALLPAAVLVHGGGWASGDKSKEIDPLFAPLTHAGIVWFSINYRLAPKHKYPACVEDVETAVKWVKAHAADYHVDPTKIALIGDSAGGHLVAMVGIRPTTPEARVAAVVPMYAPVDLVSDNQRRGALSPSMKMLFGLTDMNDESLKILRDASPIEYTKPGLPPFLLVHGTADKSVPYTQSVRLQAQLHELSVTCDLITIPGGPHVMGRWEKIDPTYKDKVASWVAKTLAAATTQPTTQAK